MDVLTIELICPMLTLIGIWADYLGRNYDDVAANKPLERVRWEALIPAAFAIMLLGLTVLTGATIVLDIRSSSYGGAFGFALITAGLAAFTFWAVSHLFIGGVSLPRPSNWIACVLRRWKWWIKPLAEFVGLPLATTVLLLEMGHYIYGVLTHLTH